MDEPLIGAWPSQPPQSPPIAGFPPAAVDRPAGWAPGGPPPLPPVPPGGPAPRGGSRGPLIAVAVVAVIALLAGAFVAGMKITRSSSESAAPSPSSSTTAPPSSSTTTPPPSRAPSTTAPGSSSGSGSADTQAVKAEVAKLQAFVEKDRGLTFKNDVEVTVLSPADFKARAVSEFEKNQDALQKQGQLLQALGLIPADADPVKIQLDLLGEGVLGFYDPETKVLVVKGTEITPFWDEIVTHELTHAIDDQNFNLNRPDIDKSTDGRSDAWNALVEGNARRVEYDYVKSLPQSTQQEIVQEQLTVGGDQAATAANIPIALAQIIQSPYDYGEPFVRSVLKTDQQAGLDAAFAKPPTSTEQILQPDKFAGKDAPKPVDRPPAEGDVVSDGTLGELMTGFALNGPIDFNDILDNLLGGNGDLGNVDPSDLLNSLLGGEGGGSVDPNQAIQNLLPKANQVKNWGGDHFVLYHSGSDLCVRVDWTMDSPQDLTAFNGQLSAWAAKDALVKLDHPSASSVRATRCIPSSGGTTSGNPGI